MNTKTITRFGAGLLFMSLLMLSTLLIYARSMHSSNQQKELRQLSFINLDKQLNYTEAAEIKAVMLQMEGVCKVNLNRQNGLITYMYDPLKQSSDNVYNKLLTEQVITGKETGQ
ncbi:MAG: hypothetical protein V4658_07015 [Bacteroidota bacterium]